MKHLMLTVAVTVLAAPVLAEGHANGDQILAGIAGNTVQGDMSGGVAYSEFYDADGTIKAEGYSGQWTIDGDQMCFDYGEGASCFAVLIDGESVTWLVDGESAGTGTILTGNPNAY